MKATHVMSTALSATLAMISPALAAGGAREDNSDFVVWVFLAFCALIVIGQMFPMIRNLRAQKPAAARKEAKEKA